MGTLSTSHDSELVINLKKGNTESNSVWYGEKIINSQQF